MFSMIAPGHNIKDVTTVDNWFTKFVDVEIPLNRITWTLYKNRELTSLNTTCTDFSPLPNNTRNLQDELFSLLYKNPFFSPLDVHKRHSFYMINPYTKLKYSAWWKEKSPRKFFYDKLSLLEKIKQLLALQIEILTEEKKLDWYWELLHEATVQRRVR